MTLALNINDAGAVGGGCNLSCGDGQSRMIELLKGSSGKEEGVEYGDTVVNWETLGVNKYAQQQFLETGETPSLLVILSSLLQDMLRSTSDSATQSDSSSLRGYSNEAAGGSKGAQPKTQGEREKRPLAEDVEYLRALAGLSQEQQQAARPQHQWLAQQGKEQHQNTQRRSAGVAGSQLMQQQHCKGLDQERHKTISEVEEIQEMLNASIATPQVADLYSTSKQQEVQHNTPPLEAVAFVVEEESSDCAVATDVGALFFETPDNESINVCCNSSCRIDSIQRYKKKFSRDSINKDCCGGEQQQLQDNITNEQHWCRSEGTLLQEQRQEDPGSMYPTRCSSGDEQQWEDAADSTREACAHAAGAVVLPEQQDMVGKQLLQQEQLTREQLQQEQLNELLWAVAAAFEIQQLHPPRIRERRKRLREKCACPEGDSQKHDFSHTENESNNSPSRDKNGGSDNNNCNASADITASGRRYRGEDDSCCTCCDAASSSSGSTGVGRGSRDVPLAGSSNCTTSSVGTHCSSPFYGSCAESRSFGSTASDFDSVASRNTGRGASQSHGHIVAKMEAGSSDPAGGRNRTRNETCSYKGSADGNNNRSSSSSHSSGVKENCSKSSIRQSIRQSYPNDVTHTQSTGYGNDHVAIDSSSRICSGESATQSCSNGGTSKRSKIDFGGRAHSSNSNVGKSVVTESCTDGRNSFMNTESHSGSASGGLHMAADLPEKAAARAALCDCYNTNYLSKETERTSSDTVESNFLSAYRDKGRHGDGCTRRHYNNHDRHSADTHCIASSKGCALSKPAALASSGKNDKCDFNFKRDMNRVAISPACVGTPVTSMNTCSTGASPGAGEFPTWRCCCGEGEAEAPAEVWKGRGLLQYDALYDRWRTFLTQFAPSGMALAVCFGKSYLFHVLHESMWQLLEELRLTAAGETPQRLRSFVLRLAAAAGLSSAHAEYLLSRTLREHGNPADVPIVVPSLLPYTNGVNQSGELEKPYLLRCLRNTLLRLPGGAREEQLGIISFCCITNDRQPQHLLQLLTIKSIFSRQLPKMPREYIVRLVFDRNHFTFCLCKRGRVTGGVCFRPYFKERFAEIAFLAVTSTEQVKGYGTRLMNHLKEHVKKSNIEYFLTYADNFALGYFRKQGFSSRITMPRDRWVGYIKDYDGGTLMECKISQKINYLQLSQLLARQKLAVKRFIEICSPAPLCPPITFWKENPRKVLSPLEIPALVKLGYTAAHWLSMQPLLPTAAVYQPTEDSEEQTGRRVGSVASRDAITGTKTSADEKKHRESRVRGADQGEGRTGAFSSSSSWWWRCGTYAANDAAPCLTAATTAGVNKVGGASPYFHPFGAGAANSAAMGSAAQPFKARVAALLSCLEKHSSSWPFRKPVSVNEAPDYYEVICKPIDIGSMKKKNRAGEYQTVGAIRADLQLMFDNCRLYNSQDTIYYKYADELQAFIWPKLNVLEEPATA